ncbi:MAG TPA: glycosyltransferase [Candidatus Binatia bacterium]|nr:glycosyltransferase [Candidatus Binatia bacterium]
MDRLRIAVALPHLGVYGGVRRFLELGRVWSERGHEVALATPPGAREAAPWLPFPGRVTSLEALPAERWDVLLSPDPRLFQEVRLPGALRVFYAVLEWAPGAIHAWRGADLVLANSEGMARHLRRRRVRAVHAPGGVNFATFHPPAEDPRPRGPVDEPVRALVYGRLSRRRKGTLAAAQAVDRAARRTGVRVSLTLFDAPPSGAAPPSEPLPISVPHRWVLHPSQETLVALYGEADLFVSAERRAGWCNTAAEAMACGAAVVCTRSGTLDFARHGDTALVSRFPWSWTLARHAEALLRDPERRGAIAARGRARIAEFPWERTAAIIETAILDRLGTGRGHRDGAPEEGR